MAFQGAPLKKSFRKETNKLENHSQLIKKKKTGKKKKKKKKRNAPKP